VFPALTGQQPEPGSKVRPLPAFFLDRDVDPMRAGTTLAAARGET
jgi:hypothetical protein